MKKMLLFVFIASVIDSYGQSKFEEVTDYFEDFAELPREQIYVHLNKSTYISDETVWFKAYVFSRDTKELSDKTSNLYVKILNSNEEVVGEKMLMSVNGFAKGQFATDSTFVSGEYTFRAYTNWSKNFGNEYTHYDAKFSIINSNTELIIKPASATDRVDVQILPESGHLLAGTSNRVGIIAKDSFGLGLANLKVEILENGIKILESQLNQFGINTIELTPNASANYEVQFYYNNKKQKVFFPKTDSKGLVMHIENSENDLKVKLNTNEETLGSVNGNLYKLTIHNTVSIKAYDFKLQNKKSQEFSFSQQDLFPGINIITLFDAKAQPIAERMYFNFFGLNFGQIGDPASSVKGDSIQVSLPVSEVDTSKFQNLSISVLPSKTKSYNHHSTIISSQLLQPYLKNPIQNAGFYFNVIDEAKKVALDKLLITEGWSRYNWTTIFNHPPEYRHNFEVGISYNLNSNSDETAAYFVYPNFNTKTEILTLGAKESLQKSGYFPINGESLRIGKINSKNQLESAKLFVQFFPSKIPSIQFKSDALTISENYQTANLGAEYFNFGELNKVQKLDEVLISKKKEYTRIEKIQNKTIGKIYEFDEKKRLFYRTFARFISTYGYNVSETVYIDPITNEYSIFRISPNIIQTINASNIPVIFLDDVPLSDYNILNNYSMDRIDYIEVNKSGIGEGLRDGVGVIRIYNKPIAPDDFKTLEKEPYTSYNIPVAFDNSKEFYAPKYSSFEDRFFLEYGVIDWKPNLKVENNLIKFKILNTGQPVKLFVEGVFNNGVLCSKEILINN